MKSIRREFLKSQRYKDGLTFSGTFISLIFDVQSSSTLKFGIFGFGIAVLNTLLHLFPLVEKNRTLSSNNSRVFYSEVKIFGQQFYEFRAIWRKHVEYSHYSDMKTIQNNIIPMKNDSMLSIPLPLARPTMNFRNHSEKHIFLEGNA